MDTNSSPFLWVVANSSFQVEGAPVDSDWYQWTHSPSKIADGSNADQACQFWTRYREDIFLAKTLGAKAFRLSIAWERIETSAGVYDSESIEHYRKILICIRDAGMEPWVTLHHFVFPTWLSNKGGILCAQFPELFQEYAFFVVASLSKSGLVKNWITFNEPNVLIRSSFLEGEWPPGEKNNFKAAALAAFHFSRAHLLSVEKIKQNLIGTPDLRFGLAMHWRCFQSKSSSLLDRIACRVTTWVFNQQITDACQSGKIKIWFPGSKLYLQRQKCKFKSLDFIGINYYGRTLVKFSPAAPFIIAEEGNLEPKSDMGWESYPSGLTDVLNEVHDRYQLPIAITENGIADRKDQGRSEFIRTHVMAMKAAISKGVRVEGYFYWSLLDNFEWAAGLAQRFGLVEMNFDTQARTPRASFYEYQKIIRENPRG